MADDNKSVIDEKRLKTYDTICKYLEDGMWFKDACILSGISEETGHRWKREDDSFDSRVEASIINYKSKMIKLVNLGAVKDGRHALEVLRTRWPKEWNVARKVELSGRVVEKVEVAIVKGDTKDGSSE